VFIYLISIKSQSNILKTKVFFIKLLHPRVRNEFNAMFSGKSFRFRLHSGINVIACEEALGLLPKERLNKLPILLQSLKL
jgi:hypothetical protein